MSQAASRGCLEAHEVQLVARAAPGELSPELAGHLATCAPCRRRLLALDIPDRARRSPAAQVPLQQRVLRILLVLGLIVVALLTLARLTKL